MPADVNSPLPDSRPLHRLIRRTRALLRCSWVATGFGLTIGLLLTTLAVLAVTDLFMPLAPITLPFLDITVPLDPLFRCVSLVLIVVPSVLALYHGVVRPLLRRLAPTQVARRIERHLPGVHNRLVSAIDLEKKAGTDVSAVFLRRLLTEALERIKSFRPAMILDYVSLRRAGVAVVMAAVVSLTTWLLFADRLPTALARIFMPFADIPPASGVVYQVAPGTADVLRDEEIPFTVRVEKGEPESLRVELYGKGVPRRFNLRQNRNDGDLWRVNLDVNSLKDGLENGFSYRVYGGNTWSMKHNITIVDRPVIAGIRNVVHYPKYMKRPRPEPVPESALAVTGPEGGQVEVVVKARGDAAIGEIQLLAPTYARLPIEKQVEEPAVNVIGTLPMARTDEETFSGRFPLADTGLFRAVLKSKQGFASKEMRGIRYVAQKDLPPYVSLQRKGTETVLQNSATIPLSITAYDDFGLDEVRVLVRGMDGGEFRSRVVWSAGNNPRTTLNVEAQLTEAASLKLSEGLRYLVEVADTKGQTARTAEFVVRAAAEGGAAERELAEFDKVQDTFQDRLVKLIGEQKKIREMIETLKLENAKLSDQLAELDDVNPTVPTGKVDPKTGKQEKAGPKLSPEELAKLAALQKELAKLAGDEKRNAETAKQLNEDLKKSIEQASKLDLMPKTVADQMSATQRAFDKMVANALKDLAKDLKDDSDPKLGKPDLKDLKDKSDRVDKELDGIKNRLEALNNARKDLTGDIKKALDALRAKMSKEDAKITARDLENLKAFIEKLREQLKAKKGKSDEVKNEADNAGTPEDKKKAEGKKEDIEKDLDKLLAKAKNLLDKKTDGDEDDPKFMPRLGGPKQKPDPRFKDKQRPVKKAASDAKGEGAKGESGKDADDAGKALESDQQTLQDLLDSIQNAMKSGKGKKGKSSEAAEKEAQLRAMMQSQEMQQAKAMAATAKAMGRGQQKGKRDKNRLPTPTDSNEGNTQGGEEVPGGQAALQKLDPAARAMIMKLPPSRYREELIRGLTEEGPEAYRAYIQDYFKRLTESKK